MEVYLLSLIHISKIGEVGSKVESFGNGVTNAGKKVSVASAAVTGLGAASVSYTHLEKR